MSDVPLSVVTAQSMSGVALRGRVRKLGAVDDLPACWAAELVDANARTWLFTVRGTWRSAFDYIVSELERRQ